MYGCVLVGVKSPKYLIPPQRKHILDGVTPTVVHASVTFDIDKGVECSVVPGCTVRELEPLAPYLKAPLVLGPLERNVKILLV